MLREKKLLSVVTGLCPFWSFASATACKAETAQAETQQPWKLLVVLLYDQDCKVTCTKVKPAMQELAQKFGPQVKYVELNAAEGTFAESIKTAESLGVKHFVTDSAEQVPVVGIFNTKKKRVKELQGFKTKDVYELAIQKALEHKS